MKINWFKINSNHLIQKFANCLVWGHSLLFCETLYHLKIGFDCKDCGKMYNYCKCYDEDNEKYENENIRKLIFNLSKYIFPRYILFKIRNNIDSIFFNYDLEFNGVSKKEISYIIELKEELTNENFLV